MSMHRGRRKLLALLLTAGLCLPAVADDSPRKTLNSLEGSIDQIRQELQQDQASKVSAARRLKQVEQRVAGIGSSLRKLQRDLDERRQRLGEYRDQRRELTKRLGRHHQELSRQVRASYYTGRQEFFKLLFNQEQPARVGRVLGYYRYYHQARLSAMDTVREDIGRLEILEEQIAAELERLKTLQARRTKEHRELLAAQRQRSAVLSDLDTRIRSKDDRLDKMLGEKKQLEKLIRRLAGDSQGRFGKAPPFVGRKDRLGWPAAGRLAASFGQARIGGLTWQGLLIRADEGSDVRAVSAGKVAFADWLPGYGMVLILEHGGGFLSLYGYNQSLLKNRGDRVETGEVIATVGNSGGQSASGLYFEIRYQGKARDPRIWLSRNIRLARQSP